MVNMADGRNADQVFAEMKALCESKADEFRLLGYENVTAKDVWDCVTAKYKEFPPLHKLVNDILSLKGNTYMNWLMINMYKNSQ